RDQPDRSRTTRHFRGAGPARTRQAARVVAFFRCRTTCYQSFTLLTAELGFIGRDALLERVERGPRRRFVVMNVDGDVAPAHAGDPVYAPGRHVGSVTSGGYGHRVGRNIAFAFVAPKFAADGI